MNEALSGINRRLLLRSRSGEPIDYIPPSATDIESFRVALRLIERALRDFESSAAVQSISAIHRLIEKSSIIER